MNENNVQENLVSNQTTIINDFPGNPQKGFDVSRWLTGWTILLSNVLLFASAVNCLFRWLAYGFAYDAVAMIVSLVAGLAVYIMAAGPKHIASPRNRLLLAISVVILWAILMPVTMRAAGFN